VAVVVFPPACSLTMVAQGTSPVGMLFRKRTSTVLLRTTKILFDDLTTTEKVSKQVSQLGILFQVTILQINHVAVKGGDTNITSTRGGGIDRVNSTKLSRSERIVFKAGSENKLLDVKRHLGESSSHGRHTSSSSEIFSDPRRATTKSGSARKRVKDSFILLGVVWCVNDCCFLNWI
jgi:hypothetical protein